MNFKLELTEQNQNLLKELGIIVENREYTTDEIIQCENIIANQIISKSLKNRDLPREQFKFSNLINSLVNNEK